MFLINTKLNLILNKLLNFNKKLIVSSVNLNINRLFHDEFTNKFQFPLNPEDKQKKISKDENKFDEINNNIPTGLKSKFNVFSDQDAMPIFDVEEERQRSLENLEIEELDKDQDIFHGINLERGITGVFEINDLVDVLKHENAEDIFICSVPKEFKYIDYMCIVTGRSYRHMNAIAEFVRRIYKMKRNTNDIVPIIEGETSRDWMAMDLGNIALHVFSKKTRLVYDLESLWSIGAEYDKECNKPDDPLSKLFTENSRYLDDLKPKK